MIELFQRSPADANVHVQRVYHYGGRRPFRAMIIFGLGFLLGWWACADHNPVIDRPTPTIPRLGTP